MTAHRMWHQPLARWWFTLSGAFLTVYLSPWMPHELHDTPSLQYLHRVVPFWLMSLGFLIYTACMLANRPRGVIFAAFLGAFFYLCETIALVWTVDPHRWNGWVLVAFASCVVFHIATGGVAVFQHEST